MEEQRHRSETTGQDYTIYRNVRDSYVQTVSVMLNRQKGYQRSDMKTEYLNKQTRSTRHKLPQAFTQ